MTKDLLSLLSGEVLEDNPDLSLAELCRACSVPAERIFEFAEEGIVDPIGKNPAYWRFRGISVRRVRCALRLERDLGVNVAGAALALELLEELEVTRARIKRLNNR